MIGLTHRRPQHMSASSARRATAAPSIPRRQRRSLVAAAAARATTTTTPTNQTKISTSSDRQREDNPFTVGLVAVLTESLRLLGVGRDRFEEADAAPPTPRPRRGDVAAVARRVADDFSRAYFVRGQLDDGVYDEDCRFADPTVAFRGVRLWRRNLALLTPFLIEPRIDLLPPNGEEEEEEEEEEAGGLLAPLLRALPSLGGGGTKSRRRDPYASPASRVVRLGPIGPGGSEVLRARWYLETTLRLPWRPLISVRGSTDYTLHPEDGNRVVDHVESWEISGTEALLQLFRPGPSRASSRGGGEGA